MVWVVKAVNGFVICIDGSEFSYKVEIFVCIFILPVCTIITIPLKADRRRSPLLKRSWIGDLPGLFFQTAAMVCVV